MNKIMVLLLFITGSAFGQDHNCNNRQLDSLFLFNFNRIDSYFPSEMLNETKNLSLRTDELAFINLISTLSGIGPSHIDYFGIKKLTRVEVQSWEHWYEMNYCKLRYKNITIALSLIEKQLTSKEEDIDKALEFPTKDMKYVQDSILNKMDTIPCLLRQHAGGSVRH